MHLLKRLITLLRPPEARLKLGKTPRRRSIFITAPAVVRQLATVGSGRMECNAALVSQALSKGWRVVYVSSEGRNAETLQRVTKEQRTARSMSLLDLTDGENTALLADELKERDLVFVRCLDLLDAPPSARRHCSETILTLLSEHLESQTLSSPTLIILDTLFQRDETPSDAIARLAQATLATGAITAFADSLARLDSGALDKHLTHSVFMHLSKDEAMLLRPEQERRIVKSGVTLATLETLTEGRGIVIAGAMNNPDARAVVCQFDYFLG